jgi:4-hydroxy-tetrahydrodipicolinate synthase
VVPHGLIAPVCTPLRPDGTLDRASLDLLVEHLVTVGVDGLLTPGPIGAAGLLDPTTRRRVLDRVLDVAAGRVPVLAAVPGAGTAAVLEEIREVGPAAVAGFVVTGTSHPGLSALEITRHLRDVAAAAPAPVLAQSSAGGTGVETAALLELLGDGALAGFVYTSGASAELRVLDQDLGPQRERVTVLAGSGVLADVALLLGADGLVPDLAAARPDLFVHLVRAHRAGDETRVRAYQSAITELSGALDAGRAYGLGAWSARLGALTHLLRRQAIIETAAVPAPLSPLPVQAAVTIDRVVTRVEVHLSRSFAPR